MSNYRAIKINGNKIDEHRYIMEQYLGRSLSRNEVVHHKDEIKNHNEIENLELMSLSEHSRKHRLGRELSEDTKQKISDSLIGHKASNRKFDDNQIEQTEELHNKGVSNRKIAKLFNVNHQTINDIINGKYYKN